MAQALSGSGRRGDRAAAEARQAPAGTSASESSPEGRPRWPTFLLGGVLLLHVCLSTIGITWGLPSRDIDPFLFGGGEPWSGERIYALVKGEEKFAATVGADVDVDPALADAAAPVSLNDTEEQTAAILLRYRLYTHQPDEMITMMALRGMNPRRLQLDPRLYQYGGLFIYPVGGLIGAAGVLGLVELRSDVPYYLDRPEEFGKFYVVARGYAAAWGAVGAVVVFAIARRLRGSVAGVLAATLFVLLPVVVCMAHEGKPHLPGAVLMLAAVLFGMRYVAWSGPTSIATDELSSVDCRLSIEGHRRRDWWLMCICCGAALGMVLSSLPIFVLIPLAAWLGRRKTTDAQGHKEGTEKTALGSATTGDLPSSSHWGGGRWLVRTVAGVAVAAVVYLITNPYILINAFVNREVLRSNFSNSLAMYEVARVWEGLERVLVLTAEGSTWLVLVLGALAAIGALLRRRWDTLPLLVPAAVFFIQFVLIGAGKPAEYGRFGVFTDAALAIGTACLVGGGTWSVRHGERWAALLVVVGWTAFHGLLYLSNFRADATADNTRRQMAELLTQHCEVPLVVTADPAPYSCPPLCFVDRPVYKVRDPIAAAEFLRRHGCLGVGPAESSLFCGRAEGGYKTTGWFATPISWANKSFCAQAPPQPRPAPPAPGP